MNRFDIEANGSHANIAFVDSVCPRPYSADSLVRGALGGAEASIVRVADALAAQVYQHNRTESDGRYHPLSALRDPSVLIVLRDPKIAAELSVRFPGVPIFVWMHDLIEHGKDRATRLRNYRDQLADAGAVVVAVSDFHKRQIESVIASAGVRPDSATQLRVGRIYNPIASHLNRDGGADVDADQLIYFSAATKGLDFALFVFRALRRRWPKLRLLVANPGYAAMASRQVDGVIDLGALPQREVHAHVAASLCAFCPNFEVAETFGLVLAESNALGTPVLAHDYGAAAEVLVDRRQIVELPGLASFAHRASRRAGFGHGLMASLVHGVGGFTPFIDRLDDWRTGGRPLVEARPQFSITKVAEHWRALIATGST